MAVQREKALAAASRDRAVHQGDRAPGGLGEPVPGRARRRPSSSGGFDFLRLLRQVPAVTEISLLDAAGREQLRVSRLAMDVVGSQADFSGDPGSPRPGPAGPYFGPVYFRKESEPYMTHGHGRAGATPA